MKNMSPTIRFLFTLTVMHVGRDMVVGSYKVPETCGACAGDNSTCRMFSGIFTRPQLPAGYNVVTTIPAGACNVSVAELKSSRNHLALRQADGGFILNGNWTTNWSGNYKESDNGATFTYIRPGEDSAESIYSPGPLQTPVELLIFYREPNPGIQYKYQLPVTESQKESYISVENTISRSLPAENQLLNSEMYGISKSNRSSEMEGNEVELSPRLRKRKVTWKMSGFSECSKPCGGGYQVSIVLCVREYNQQTIPDRRCSSVRKPVLQTIRCNNRPCVARWMTDDWSSCSSTCGDGVQTRNVFCKQEISPSLTVTVDDGACTSPPPTNLERSRSCHGPPCPGSMGRESWVTGSWSECSSRCGVGTMTRTVHCPSGDCPDNTRPVSQSSCDNGPCRGDIPITSSSWLTTEWSHECSVSCGTGIQTRKVYCSDSNCDVRYRPDIYRTCTSDRQCRGQWYSGPWSQCSETCGMGKQTRDIVCLAKVRDQLVETADSNCVILDKPTAEQQCHVRRCDPQWYVAEWAQCSHSCGSGVQRRECLCLDEHQQRSNLCRMEGKPLSHRPCHVQHCSSHTNWRPVNEVSRAYESSSYRNRTYSMDTNGLNVVESGCSDKYHNCRMVVQARLCKYKYYRSSCCQACTHRHNSPN